MVSANNITEVNGNGIEGEEEVVESVGGADALEEVPERTPRLRRQYKIQEVIKRRQVMLVQVVKEERGTKGAALTTYLSLAGRYSVLMPNTARGGGISRKITSADDRRRLKDIAQELEVPEGMGVILRTAGASRTKTEVKRDFEYLLRLWETVRDLTLKSTAPMLVYEEGSLVKRSIRDLYNKDIDEILVAGEDAHKEAKDFMRMLMPSHAKNVKPYRDTLPIFTRNGIESQLDAMFTPVMQLRSGGYIVLNQAEALVAIDVNSGRATREHHIEDTALKTNLEAAEEIARQLRLRDLAGLIVIDFIDMDEKRNNRAVERRLKECLRHDRARIQVGHISHFGLLEMSRQRIRSSVLESSTEKCPQCGGTGHVRSVASVALQLLRSLEETLLKGATHNLMVRTRSEIALYLLNHKRAHLRAFEERFRITIMVNADASISGPLSFVIEKGEQVHSLEQAKALALAPASAIPIARTSTRRTKTRRMRKSRSRTSSTGEESLETQEAADVGSAAAAQTDGVSKPKAASGGDAGADAGAAKSERATPRRKIATNGSSIPHEVADIGARTNDHEDPEGPDAGNGAAARDTAGTGMTGTDIDRHRLDWHRLRLAPTRLVPTWRQTETATANDGGEGEDAGAADAIGVAAKAKRRRSIPSKRAKRGNRRCSPQDGVVPEPELAELASAPVDGQVAAAPPSVTSIPISQSRSEGAAGDKALTPAASNHCARAAPQEEPAAQTAAVGFPEKTPQAPRRRSTVREPAPTVLREEGRIPPAEVTSSAPPEPVVSSSAESEASDRPRRSGWWSKRALGKD